MMKLQDKRPASNQKRIAYISIFVTLTAIGAFIKIPTFIPFTLQVFFVLLAGFVLGARGGFISQAAYLVLGLIGLPVFSNFTGGISAVFSPSFGFLLSFPITAALVGYLSDRIGRNNFFKSFLSLLTGLVPLYLLGLLYYMYYMNRIMGIDVNIIKALQTAFLPFIAFDILKAFIAVIVGRRILKIMDVKKD